MIVNFLLFQLGWFASVLSAARQTPALGVVVVTVAIGVDLAMTGSRRELLVVGTSAAMGALADSLLLHPGLIDLVSARCRDPMPQSLARRRACRR